MAVPSIWRDVLAAAMPVPSVGRYDLAIEPVVERVWRVGSVIYIV
jgi:hypothetical protein